jgi:transcriptional regulator with XRE-family HTH domain
MSNRTLDFGKKVRGRRKSLGLTQDELAALIQVGSAAVGYWERGRNLPSDLDQLHAPAEAFGVSACWLIGDEAAHAGYPPIHPDVIDALKDERIQKVVRFAVSATDEQL